MLFIVMYIYCYVAHIGAVACSTIRDEGAACEPREWHRTFVWYIYILPSKWGIDWYCCMRVQFHFFGKTQ